MIDLPSTSGVSVFGSAAESDAPRVGAALSESAGPDPSPAYPTPEEAAPAASDGAAWADASPTSPAAPDEPVAPVHPANIVTASTAAAANPAPVALVDGVRILPSRSSVGPARYEPPVVLYDGRENGWGCMRRDHDRVSMAATARKGGDDVTGSRSSCEGTATPGRARPAR
jgi:hypothetical protein